MHISFYGSSKLKSPYTENILQVSTVPGPEMEMKRYLRSRLMYNEKAVSRQRQLPLYAVSDANQDLQNHNNSRATGQDGRVLAKNHELLLIPNLIKQSC